MHYLRDGRSDHVPTLTTPASAEPHLVGRGNEMRRLESMLTNAASGRGTTVFIAGVTGVGKTRLAREVLDLARARDFLVLAGQAYALEGGLAYALILDALGPHLRHLDPARQAHLVGGLPDLGRLFADLRLPAADPLGDPFLEKTRLFEATLRLLERIARERPIAIFLDDLHWADAASLELLHYLARGLGDQRVLLLVAYRADELDPARRLARLVASLRRARLCEEVTLTRLQAGSTAELACDLLGAEPPVELVKVLEARAVGIPLFVTALIRALVDAGQLARNDEAWELAPEAAAMLPLDVRDLILERLDGLDAIERRVLDLIAVNGEAVPFHLLDAVSGLDDERLEAALQRLCAAGLVAEELAAEHVCYRLGHPLVQEVAYAALPEMTRRRAHAGFARALEARGVDDPSDPAQSFGRLAHHYFRAGREADRRRALEILLKAGDQAREVFANDQAAAYFGAALGIIREENQVQLLPSTLEKLGEAWERVGEVGAAIAMWGEALAARQQAGDRTDAARLRRLLALAEWDRGGFEAAQTHVVAGLASLADQGSSPERADLLGAHALILSRLGDCPGCVPILDELTDVAHGSRSPRTAALAHLVRAGLLMEQKEYASGVEEYRLALVAAEEAEDSLLVQRVHNMLAWFKHLLGDTQSGRQHLVYSLELARRLGAPPLELYPQCVLALLEFTAGNWVTALDRIRQADVLARRLGVARGAAYVLGFRALLLAWSERLEEAEACLAEARSLFGGDRPVDRPGKVAGLAEAMIAVRRADFTRAQAIADSVPITGAEAIMLPLKLALLGEAQARAGMVSDALATAQELAALAPSDTAYPIASGKFIEGLACLASGDSSGALAPLARAADLSAALNMPFESARAHLEWAYVAAAGDRVAAVAVAQESLTVFERLDARSELRRARALLRDLGVRPPQTRRASREKGPLSVREMEVARLVAQGLTNAEIAKRLVLSPRTVTTHLEHIYARLGLSSRQALIQYVAQAERHPSVHHNT
ncbi:MAG: AAA family ATPase [Chloroflexi bacterium]|nr:AAA family ATPase [Chloroflexota bacterium]